MPVTDWVPFADWADGRVLLGGRRPTAADLDYHLTTLFPPVRPRGFLEIRYLDSVPDAVWPAVVFTLATLLDDPAAADIAAEATEPVATAWDRAAQIGLGDRRLHEAADRCVQAAAERAPAELAESMQRLVAFGRAGPLSRPTTSPTAWSSNGIAPAVTELAQGRAVTARERLARRADPGARAHAAAGRVRRRRTAPAVRPVDEPAGVGPRAHRPAGGAVAAARQRPATGRACCHPTVERLYDAFEQLARQPGRPAAAAAGRSARATARPCATRRSTPSTRCPTTTHGVRLRAGGQPREPARRDDAAGAEPAVRPAAAGRAARRCPPGAPAWPARRCWCPAGRSSSASTRPTEPLLAGQRAPRARRRRARRSGSAGCR